MRQGKTDRIIEERTVATGDLRVTANVPVLPASEPIPERGGLTRLDTRRDNQNFTTGKV
jgi:hypothetical protein